jgi:hypothetical protein
MRKIYIHVGKGFYIGSTVIVMAASLEEAQTLISQELKNMGLAGEALDIKELKIPKSGPFTVYVENGDY